jgi:hypothetical protein
MSPQTLFLALLVVLYGTAQYVLMAQALRDLARRTRVRGNNKVLWGIVILTIPIAGALLYSWMGPTSLRRRAGAPDYAPMHRRIPAGPIHDGNVTSIRAARDRRERAAAANKTPHERAPQPLHWRASTPSRPQVRRFDGDAGTPRPPRTGS